MLLYQAGYLVFPRRFFFRHLAEFRLAFSPFRQAYLAEDQKEHRQALARRARSSRVGKWGKGGGAPQL